MQPAGIVTLIGAVLTVGALVIYLTAVALMLKHVNFTLGTIIAGVRAIANQAEPLAAVINDIETDLSQTRGALEGLIEAKTGRRMRGVLQRRR